MRGEQKTQRDLDWQRVVDAVGLRLHRDVTGDFALPIAQSFEQAHRSLAEVNEALDLIERGDPLPLGGFLSVDESLLRLQRDAALDGPALANVITVLQVATNLRRFIGQRRAILPYLDRACAFDPTLDSLHETLSVAIEPDGTIADSASLEIAKLRVETKNLRERITARLQTMIQKHQKILQDQFFTLREGRYVLPVRSDAHERFKGIVHGSSASGATLFVEPEAIVERGNRLKMAQADLEREKSKVLSALSARVREQLPAVHAAVVSLEHADLRNACARLGHELDGRVITLAQAPVISLKAARHPLLQLDGVDVVPNDLSLKGGRALVLSGPNAGGKTVALKTIGLFSLMMRAGLPVPAAEGSEFGFFTPVLSSVGDGQSLERNLSTYTAQMQHVIEALNAATDRVLVLFDELASATDPEAGAYLACAIVRTLVERGAAVAVTTHYQPLKTMAMEHPDMDNAAVGFDTEALAPTFEITLGVPGTSSALEVASRCGLPDDVIQMARRDLPEHTAALEELLTALNNQRLAQTKTLEALDDDRRALQAERATLQAKLAEQKARDARALSKEAEQLMQEIVDARNDVKEAKRQIRARGRTQVDKADHVLDNALAVVNETQQAAQAPSPGTPATPGTLSLGDNVWISHLNSEGTVLEVSDRNKVRVAAGMMKLWVDIDQVRKLDKSPPKREPQARVARPAQADDKTVIRTRDNTLDVRGLRVDEALSLTEAFLDRVYSTAHGHAYILHGVGSGALRQAIHERLAHQASYVSNYRVADSEEGGPQWTIVSLK